MKKQQLGFTFIETFAALSIIAIISLFSLSVLRNFYDNSSDAILQTQLLEFIHIAEQEARTRHIPIALCKSNNQTTCSGAWIDGQLVFMDENEDGMVRNSGQILAVFQSHLPHGILHLRAFPNYRDYLLFLPNGLTNTDNSLFWFCHASRSFPLWAIALAKSGRVRVLHPDKRGVIKDAHGKVLQCDDESFDQ